MSEYKHIPVLLNEAIESLNIKPDGIYVDCTLGGGGHSSEILKRLTTGKLISFDQDEYAISVAEKKTCRCFGDFFRNYLWFIYKVLD
jgi:16S rRNA (cytosine1402-N4)-methyltransferase